jgi:hypothetical protein
MWIRRVTAPAAPACVRLSLVLTTLLTVVLAAPRAVEAGALAKTVGGIRSRSASSSRGGSSGSGSPASGSNSVGNDWSDPRPGIHRSYGYLGWDPALGFYGYRHEYGVQATSAEPLTLRVHAYGGLQAVQDSDRSYSGEAHVTFGPVGFAGHILAFREPPEAGSMLTTRLDLFTLGLELKVFSDDDERTQLWFEGDYAGVSATTGIYLHGLAGGARLQRNLGGLFAVFVAARGYLFPATDIKAGELQAGVQVTVLRLSYRVVDFDVGPPLGGPEAGLAFSF